MQKHRRRRALALLTVLVMSTVLLMMVLALYTASRGSLFGSLHLQRRTAALYVAEAGLAQVMEDLETSGFAPPPPGPWTGTMPGGGTWSVQFHTAGAPGPNDSIFNLVSPAAASSYRGAATVPPFSALVVVTGTVGDVRQVLEAVITRGGGGPPLSNALQASGAIKLKGSVKVDGVKALDDGTPVPGKIQSNASTGTSVEWDPGAGPPPPTIQITGTVSHTGGSVDLNGYVPGGGDPVAGVTAAFPSVDVVSEVSAKAGSPPPAVVPFGTTVIPSGDFYHSGDLTIDGDLKLGGGNLYVSGKLTVNGSVSGDGSVYVADKTTLMGDSKILSNEADGNNVSLYSRGSVTLKGFDGDQYLANLANADPTVFGKLWGDARATFGEMQTLLAAHPVGHFGPGGAQNSALDRLRRTLGQQAPGDFVTGRQLNTLGKIKDYIAAQPAGPTKAFLEKKFKGLREFYAAEDDLGMPNDQGQSNWENGIFDAGATLDSLMDGSNVSRALALLPDMIAYTNSVNYDRMGSAYFRGSVYTNGYLHTTNDISVLGAVMADGDPALGSETLPDGRTANPGDILLDNHSHITFVESMFNGAGGGTPGATLSTEAWLGR
jgi:hypothetical protein